MAKGVWVLVGCWFIFGLSIISRTSSPKFTGTIQANNGEDNGKLAGIQHRRSVHAIGHWTDFNLPHDQERPANGPQTRPANADPCRRFAAVFGVASANQSKALSHAGDLVMTRSKGVREMR